VVSHPDGKYGQLVCKSQAGVSITRGLVGSSLNAVLGGFMRQSASWGGEQTLYVTRLHPYNGFAFRVLLFEGSCSRSSDLTVFRNGATSDR